MPQRVSAGLLLYRKNQEELEVFLVHPGGPYFQNKDLGHWSIPKGEIDEGEQHLKCAIRELKEETGLTVSENGNFFPLGSVQQKGGKIVHAWAIEFTGEVNFDNSKSLFTIEWPPKSGKSQKFPEVDKAEFFFLKEAKEKIKPAQAEFIDKLVEFLKEN
ncbi:MAG: NUDIX domain-containing protein [Bacillota bacterium]